MGPETALHAHICTTDNHDTHYCNVLYLVSFDRLVHFWS